MARIRSIKPELRTSLIVAEWPRDVRYAWVLLWGYLDDHGRGVDNTKLIAADLFPLDDDVTATTIDEWLQLMANAGPSEDPDKPPPLCRYQVGGRRYLHATSWKEHQKPSHPTPSRVPPCPHHEHAETGGESLPKSSGAAPEQLRPEQVVGAGSREQGAGSARERPSPGASSTGTAVDSLAALGVAPNPHDARCQRHQGHPNPPACGGCGAARRAAEAAAKDHATAAARAAVAAHEELKQAAKHVPHCGDRSCNPDTRWRNTPTGRTRCPECHEVSILARAQVPRLAVVGGS